MFTAEQLQKDREQWQARLIQAQQQAQFWTQEALRLQGVLSYINQHLNGEHPAEVQEAKNDKAKPDRT